MEISKGVINEYLRQVLPDIYDDRRLPFANTEDYHDLIVKGIPYIEYHNDLETFRFAIDYLMCHPEIKLESLSTSYDMEDEEFQQLLPFMRKVMYPNAKPIDCEEVKQVKIVPMSKFEWWKQQTKKGLHPVEALAPVFIEELKSEGWQPPLK